MGGQDPPAFETPAPKTLGLRHAHPVWLVEAFAQALAARGRPPQELADLLAADNVAPEVTLVARPGRCTQAELVDAGARPGRWSPFAAVWPSGDPGALAAVRDHRAGVQDEGSQLVTAALVAAPLTPPTGAERWLDMCAGPGGKAALLAALAQQQDASLQAWELLPHRARLVKQAVGAGVEVRVVDAGDPQRVSEASGGFDRVLLDAPCSGAGALRRRPEARWRKQPQDLTDLVAGQRRLLQNALRLVRPGGVVAYVTCSPLLVETSAVVDAVLAEHKADVNSDVNAVVRVDARALLPGLPPDVGAGPDVQLWPHLHGTDAMYLSLLRPDNGP